MSEIKRKKNDDMLYMMTMSSELGDQISAQPRQSKVSPNFVLSLDEALDSLQMEVQNHRTYIEASFQDTMSTKIDNLGEVCKGAVLMIEEHDFAVNLDFYSSRMIAAFLLRQQIMMDLPDIKDALNKAERYLRYNGLCCG